MIQVVLRPHPQGPATPLEGVAVEVLRPSPGRIRLRYLVTGGIEAIDVPPPVTPARVDELWKHTCFEVFLRGGGERYWEFNLAPSSQWAAYGFESYRRRVADPDVATPAIQVQAMARTLALTAELDLSAVAGLDPTAPWNVGLSAVIEDKAGERSYWALAHPPGKPDFHHASAFTLHLPPSDHP
jgi:hypothetical protein